VNSCHLTQHYISVDSSFQSLLWEPHVQHSYHLWGRYSTKKEPKFITKTGPQRHFKPSLNLFITLCSSNDEPQSRTQWKGKELPHKSEPPSSRQYNPFWHLNRIPRPLGVSLNKDLRGLRINDRFTEPYCTTADMKYRNKSHKHHSNFHKQCKYSRVVRI
jgi:hypothetical protein